MRRWTTSWPCLLTLTIAVTAIVVLLILPDVDPPDTAFHRGTAPVVVHSQASVAPMLFAPGLPARVSLDPLHQSEILDQHVSADSRVQSSPIFLESLRV